MDIEYSDETFMEGSTKTNFAVSSTKVYLPGRSYLSPRVVIEGQEGQWQIFKFQQVSRASEELPARVILHTIQNANWVYYTEELFLFSQEKSIAES